MSIKDSKKIFKENKEKYFEDYFNFLKIPTISSDPTKKEECKRGAEFLKSCLSSIGFKSELIKTDLHPLVYGEYKVKDAKETVLIYGHYDVQAVEPISEWKQDPFMPVIKKNKVYARGAEDNKGQLFYIIKAIESLIKNNELKYNVKFIIDGEEENASVHTAKALPSLKTLLKCDYLLVCDSSTSREDVGMITIALRGICFFDIKMSGLKSDLHSGSFGGVVPNPAVELSKLIASFYDKTGKIAVKNFYDGTWSISKIKKNEKLYSQFDEEMCKKVTGVQACGGEKGLNATLRAGLRPTIEVNGIYSGYQGEGSKTIIPATATAKISCRLVQDQNPIKVAKAIQNHIKEFNKSPFKCEMITCGGDVGEPALTTDINSVGVKKAKACLEKICKKVEYKLEGGSIPILLKISNLVGKKPILAGFGLPEDNIHAPNESFSVNQFEKGFCFIREFLGND